MPLPQITSNRLKALEALAFFHYLTLEQFLRLGITSDKSNLAKRVLHPIRDCRPALVECAKRSATDEDVYCLRAAGAAVVADHRGCGISEISFPQDGIQYSLDFSHRRRTIDFLIALKQWADAGAAEIDFVRAYYQRTGSQRKGKKRCVAVTRHWLNKEAFEPDLELRLNMIDGRSRLFAFELHNGRDAGKVIEQLLLHTRAIKAGTLPKHYNHGFANYVLSVYTKPAMLKAVCSTLAADWAFAPFKAHFLFNTSASLQESFAKGWVTVEDRPAKLFS